MMKKRELTVDVVRALLYVGFHLIEKYKRKKKIRKKEVDEKNN